MLKKLILIKVFLALLAMLIISACSAQQSHEETAPTEAAAAPTSAPVSEPEPTAVSPTEAASAGEAGLTLRLAIPDSGGRANEPFILEFADQVEAISGGEMAVEILWDAGANTEEGYEHGVLAAVLDGDYELGLAASRIFEHEGITTLQPLQTPFLIDNDALAIAVAGSDVAAEMLDALSSSGLAGLTLWPEDLRHPFSVVPGEPVLSPDDLAGQTVRTTSEGITSALIEALGGTPELEADNYQRAEAGLLQGYSLSGRPIGTADVAFFSKYQVLFGNGEAFAGLSAEQQAILREAAAVAQAKALAEHPGDAAAGAAWCADGGTVVLAGEEQIAAFKEAAQPVVEMITADPANAEAVAALRELKENTVPSAGAEACAPAAQAQSEADPSTYANGVLNGTWDYVASEEEAAFFFSDYGVTADEVRIQLGFDNEEWWEAAAFDGETFLENGVPVGGGGTFQIEDDRLITIGAQGRALVTFEWSLDGDQLTLIVVEECDITSSGGLNCRDDKSQIDPTMMMVMEHTYTKSSDSPRPWEEWTEGLPPNGVWTVDLTIEDIVRMGVLESNAPGWAGLNSYEFNDGEGIFRGEFLDGVLIVCPFTYEVVDDFFRLSYVDKGLGNYECGEQEDDLQWRLDEEGLLHFNVVAVHEGLLLENTALYEARPWRPVE